MSVGLVFWGVLEVSASDVQDDSFYIFFYLVLATAWYGAVERSIDLLGISAREDVLERRNGNAVGIIWGAQLGAMLCFLGANVGNGPGVHVVLFSGLLSTGTLFLTWLSCEGFLRRSFVEEITVERDLGTSLRWGGFFLAVGIILGWSVAGDWVSVEATIADFAYSAWPVLPFAALAVMGENLAHSSRSRSGTVRSIVIGAFWVLMALYYIAFQEGKI